MLRLIDISETQSNDDMVLWNESEKISKAVARHIEETDNLFEDLNYLLGKSEGEEDFVRITKELIGVTLSKDDYIVNNLSVFISEEAYPRILKEYNIHFLTQIC